MVNLNAKNQRKVRFYLPSLSCTFDLLVKIDVTERWKIEQILWYHTEVLAEGLNCLTATRRSDVPYMNTGNKKIFHITLNFHHTVHHILFYPLLLQLCNGYIWTIGITCLSWSTMPIFVKFSQHLLYIWMENLATDASKNVFTVWLHIVKLVCAWVVHSCLLINPVEIVFIKPDL